MEQTVRQDVLTLRMDLAVKNNATVLTKTVIMSADVCSQQKVTHCVYNYIEKSLHWCYYFKQTLRLPVKNRSGFCLILLLMLLSVCCCRTGKIIKKIYLCFTF